MGSAIQSMANAKVVIVHWKEQILSATFPEPTNEPDALDNFIFMRPVSISRADGIVQLWKGNDRHQTACVDGENPFESGKTHLSIGCGAKQGHFKASCYSHFDENGNCKVFALDSEFNKRLVRVNSDGVLDVSDLTM